VQGNRNNTSEQISQLKKEARKYLRYWYLFVIGVLIAFVLLQLKLRYTPKEFSTVSKIKILDKSKGLELPSAAFIFNRSNINLDNEIELIKSYDVLEKVVDKTDLTYRFYEEGNVLTSEITGFPFKLDPLVNNKEVKWGTYKFVVLENEIQILNNDDELLLSLPEFSSRQLKHNLPFDVHVFDPETLAPSIGKTYVLNMIPMDHATNTLKNKLEVEITGRSSDVLQLSLKSENGPRSEEVLNTLHDVVEEDGKNDRKAVQQNTLDFIEKRFKILVGELDSIEINKQNFKVDNRFISPEADLQRGMATAIQSEEELFRIESQLNLLDFIKGQLRSETQELSLLPNSFSNEDLDVNSIINEYNTLIFERVRLTESGGANNPQIRRINENLDSLRQNIMETVNAAVAQLNLLKRQLEERDDSINEEFVTLPEKERLFRDIERQQRIKETLYLFLYQKREEALINIASTESSIKVIEAPLSSQITTGLNGKSAIVFAVLGGLAIPFGILYLIFLLDTKLHGKEDINAVNPEIPIVGEIPEIKKSKEIIFKNPNDRSVLAEAFRILCSNVDFLLPVHEDERGRVVFCTSTIKGEGKTYVSMNLSLALASLNKKVLLIGADLRNPQIHSFIDLDKHKTGLSNYLHDPDVDWRDALVQSFEQQPSHRILLSGSIPPNPAHLLTNGRFKQLIEEARQEYDYIIVDTAPTILVTDTMLISKLADATLYIARANFTDKSLLAFSKELFESGKLNNMAYVLNSVSASRAYGYSYNYGYGYGYGSQA
jgi:capsular exopolysaccharide synthesis family protein